MGERVEPNNPLARGFYTPGDAARLIEKSSLRRIRGWLLGYEDRTVGPVMTRDYVPISGHQELSFLDLIELRFIEHFREHGVKMKTLRSAAFRLRREFETTHPFATDHVHLIADKADIFRVIMRETGHEAKDRALMSLTTDNYILEEMIKRGLVPGITFEADSHLAKRWKPRPATFSEIVVDPRVAYGQPCGPSGIPTGTLFDAWRAEGEDYDAAASWFGVKAQDISRAVDFERALIQPLEMAT